MKTATQKILPLLLAAGALALAGCSKNSTDPVAPNNSPGQFVDDTAITAKVKAALAGDSAVKSSEISVTTNSGVVTLSGQVDNSDQKSAAVKDAGAVSGVKDVTNNLTTP
jgi:hyperosmotically inducible protein